MKLHEQRLPIDNHSAGVLELLLEPWGMLLALEPGKSVMVCLVSAEFGEAEVEQTDMCIRVFAWPGCRVEVRDGERVLHSTLEGPAVPNVPQGMSVLAFVKRMFSSD